jgi:hypothetical protein
MFTVVYNMAAGCHKFKRRVQLLPVLLHCVLLTHRLRGVLLVVFLLTLMVLLLLLLLQLASLATSQTAATGAGR